MFMEKFETWLRLQLAGSGFTSDDSANVVSATALCAIPLILIAGVAIDSSRLSSAQVEAQAAADAAALSAAAAYASGNGKYVEIANKSFDQNIANNKDLANASLATNVEVDTRDNTLTVRVSGNIPTTLMQIGGFDEMSIGTDLTGTVSSTVSLPVFSDHNKGQIILVMDYSSSM